MNQKIVITTDGKITTAKLYENGKVVNTAEAKCYPKDTFDFKVGAKLAVERLSTVDKWKVVKRPVKVGDYIRLIEPDYSFDKVGDILKVDKVCNHEMVTIYEKNHPNQPKSNSYFPWSYFRAQYEVVEKVTNVTKVEETPKYYNGKVVCVNSGYGKDYLTVGKIYTFVDGVGKADNGADITSRVVKDVNDLNFRFSKAKFIEIKE